MDFERTIALKELTIGNAGWAPDYKSSDPSAVTYLLTREEHRIVALLKGLRPGQELRVIRDELGGPLGYKVYDIIGSPE